VTSETGAGKTWVLDNLVRPVLAALALLAQGKTTEAGLRGELRLDARPVVFDEAESQNDADRARMQQVLDLARAASSEGGADIIKGTRDGGATRYRIRSCFAFASVNLGLSQAADESRAVVLNIAPSPDKEAREDAFERLKRLHAEVLTPDFPARLLARTLKLLPAIRTNADVLAAAISRGGVSRRTGDTLGVILACVRSLHGAGTMTAREADAFVAERAWVRDTAKRAEVTPEWERALSHLMQAEVRLVATGSGRLDVTTMGDLVGACVGVGTPGISKPDADTALKRHGLRVLEGRLLVGSKSDPVRRIFASTPWAAAFYATISRAPGARKDVQTRFSPAYKDKCVSVPVSLLTDDG
jgi:putative DNA primase/helicase